MPVQVHLKLVTLFGDTRQKMHKQLSQGENQGAYSYSKFKSDCCKTKQL